MTTPDHTHDHPAATPHTQLGGEKETGRIEAFSDGVLAIAITLLSFDLRLPTQEAINNVGFLGALIANWPTYLGYLAGFASILVMWINHHRLFTAIRRCDDTLLLLNGLLLLTICVVPFTTKMAAEFLLKPEANVAVAVYGFWGLVIALAFNGLWRYASHENRLFSPNTDLKLVAFISRQYSFGPVFYVVAMALALVNGVLGLLWCLGLAVFFALPNSAFRRMTASGE
jgi:uncharacterized membrane protein